MPLAILTGYSGLLGRAVLADLIKESEVVCIGRTPPPLTANASFLEANLADGDVIYKLPRQADKVIHLAQAQGFQAFPDKASEVFNVNVATVSRLLDWSLKAGVKTFVHASSGGLYGTAETPFDETDPVRIEGRLSNYLTSKHCAELLANAYQSYFSVVALRYFFIYGPGQQQHMLLPRLIANVRQRRPIEISGENGIHLNPVFVTDAAKATLRASELTSSATFNVAGREILSLRHIVDQIGLRVGEPPQIKVNPSSSQNNVAGKIERMSKHLWEPVVRFSEGLAQMC